MEFLLEFAMNFSSLDSLQKPIYQTLICIDIEYNLKNVKQIFKKKTFF